MLGGCQHPAVRVFDCFECSDMNPDSNWHLEILLLEELTKAWSALTELFSRPYNSTFCFDKA